MFAIKFDDKMRAAKAKGIEYRKIDTVFEGTPEFNALWSIYAETDDLLYHICTEDDGRTHTFFRIYLPTTNTTIAADTKEAPDAEAD